MEELLRHRAAAEAAPVGLVWMDLQGRIIRTNPYVRDMLGYTENELLGVRFLTAFTPATDAATEAELFLQLLDGRRDRYQLEKRYLRKDQEIVWTRLKVVRINAAERPFCLSVIENITQERRQLQTALQGEKLDALTRLAGELVYRLNHVMVAALGSSQLLLESIGDQDRNRHHVESIRDAMDCTASLTRQMVAFCSRQALTLTDVDLNSFLNRHLPQFRNLLGQGYELNLSLQRDAGRIRSDEPALHRALQALITNAREAMPAGGRVTISTAIYRGGQPPGADGDPRPPTFLRLSVSDTGCGMDSKCLDRLFEPFFTTKQHSKSRGLGLAGVFGFIRQCEGNIEVDSQPGQGTTVHMYFPKSHETLHDLELPANLAETQQGGRTILLVEDDDHIRAQLRRTLRAGGYHVLEARYGGEALLTCLKHEGPIQILITDVAQPHLSGKELAEQAASLRPELRVLYLGQPPDQGLELEEAPLHSAYLRKPVTPEALLESLRNLIRSTARSIDCG